MQCSARPCGLAEWLCPPPSLAGAAVEQAGAAGGLQVVQAAAARAVGGIPRHHVPGGLQPGAVVMADDRRALATLGPVAAGGVAAGGRVVARRIRAGEDVVLIWSVAA